MNQQAGFCDSCRQALIADRPSRCPRCAATIGPYTHLDNGCSRCRDVHFHFDRAIRLGPYDGLLRDLVLRMKKGAGEALAEVLGDLWADHSLAELRELRPDVVIPVPLHWWRRWIRGYNQSETLARAVADRLQLTFPARLVAPRAPYPSANSANSFRKARQRSRRLSRTPQSCSFGPDRPPH